MSERERTIPIAPGMPVEAPTTVSGSATPIFPQTLSRGLQNPNRPPTPRPSLPPPPVPKLLSTPLPSIPSVEPLPEEPESGPADAGEDPLIGTWVLGQFVLVKQLGIGGFGTVYLADQVGLDRKAVVKVAQPALSGETLFRQRFEREAKVLASLDNHHLVKLYNWGELDSGRMFLVMEYGGDRTLAEEIHKVGKLPAARAFRIARQICEALEEAHRKGIVHRDLKPANILLGMRDDEDWVKVVDVGIAKMIAKNLDGTSGERLTLLGDLIGTPAYFSPEQARGLPVDGRADLYSLGVVLYEMLTGLLPINAQSPLDFVHAHSAHQPKPLADHGLRLTSRQEAIVFRALAKDPTKRFQSAREFGAAIDAVSAGGNDADRTSVQPGGSLGQSSGVSPRVLWFAVLALAGGVLVAALLIHSSRSQTDPVASIFPNAPPALRALRPRSSVPTLPPGELVMRAPGREISFAANEETPSPDGMVKLRKEQGTVTIWTPTLQWNAKWSYKQSPERVDFVVPAEQHNQVRVDGLVISQPGLDGHFRLTTRSAPVVVTNEAGEDLTMVFLYKPAQAGVDGGR